MSDFNREAVYLIVDVSLPSSRLVLVFGQIRAECELPRVLRTDDGPELLGEMFGEWASKNLPVIGYFQLVKPNQNECQ